MSLTSTAIRNDRVTCVALLVLLVAGLMAYFSLPRAEDPGFIVRTAQIVTHFPGASPERVEQLVTDRLEKAIQEMPELDFVKSESKTGVSIIFVNVKERYSNMRPIWDSLRRKVERAQQSLPDGVRPPIVNDEFGDVFGVVLTVIGEGFTYAEVKQIADDVRNELLRLSEVAKVDIFGAQEERVFVEYSNARLAELALSPLQLQQTLEAQNIVIPGGSVVAGRERITLEPSGNFESVADLERTVIQLPGRRDTMYLRDIARVYRGYVDPPASRVTSSGAPALALAVSLREGGNILTLGEQTRGLLARLQAAYPIGVEFDVVSFQPGQVQKKVRDFTGNLLQAIGVVAVVMLVTLGLRTGLVVASLIPMAMIASLFVMSVLHIGLDQISLAALIIALGLLVDNGIVMSESILVQMEAGKPAVEAAVDSAGELQMPLLTSSLTTAAAFLPIFLAESATGEYTAPLFKVVTITLLASWVLALTLIPLLAVRFIRPKRTGTGRPGFDTRFYRAYRAVLLGLLRHRLLVLGATLAMFAGALYGLGFVPKVFFPPSDRPFFKAEIELPLGSDIEATTSTVREVERHIERELRISAERREGVTNWVSYIGSGGPRFVLTQNPEPPSAHYALMVINASSVAVIDRLMATIERFVLAHFPDAQPTLTKFQNGPPIERPVQIRIMGADLDTLFGIVNAVGARLTAIPGAKNVSEDWGSRSKKLFVRINQPRARRAGISNQDIAVSLQTGLSGLEITQYREGDEVIPVLLRSVAADRQDLGKLETLNVYAQATGESIPLKQVADVEVQWEPAKILRRDRIKTVTLGAELKQGVTAAEVFGAIAPWLAEQQEHWPLGYRFEFGGEAETSVKANRSIGEKLPIAVLLVLLLLVGQFNSVRRTLIVLLTIPLGLIGVTIGLLAANSYFGFMTLLGIISLAGIVINNAIVLLDRITIEVAAGRSQAEAVIASAQQRLRPILLTTATTMLGLVPLWLGGGEMWEPLAIAIIFGLLFSTVLTLGFVPVLYSLFFRVDFRPPR